MQSLCSLNSTPTWEEKTGGGEGRRGWGKKDGKEEHSEDNEGEARVLESVFPFMFLHVAGIKGLGGG